VELRRSLIVGLCALLAVLTVASSGQASHEDGYYEISAWDMWDQDQINVLVIPPEHGPIFSDGGYLDSKDQEQLTPFNTYLKAVEDSIAAWSAAAQTFGSAELRKAFNVNVFVLGRDVPSQEALSSPDIIITTTDFTPLGLGVAFRPYPCFVNNSQEIGLTNYADIFNINGQEYGHCLGVNHVGSQGGVDPTSHLQHPEHDIMNGFYTHDVGDPTTHLHCISNLDILALNWVFTHKNLGQIPVLHRDTGDLEMEVAHFRNTCGSEGLEPDSPVPFPGPETTVSRITSPQDGSTIKTDRLKSIAGIVEGKGASGVEITLVRQIGAKCLWFKPLRNAFRKGDCETPFWFTSDGSQWQFELPDQLPEGIYEVRARAIDADMGVIEDSFEPGRNVISFTIL
jgi:hypothetical protein